MKQPLLLFLIFLLGAIHSLSAQSAPQLTVNVWPVTDAHVCGTSLVTVEFSNSGTNCVYLYNIQVDLNPGQSGNITYKDLTKPSKIAGFTMTGPSVLGGTSQPTFSYSGSVLPQTSVLMTMEVQYSCDFFDMLNQLNGYHVEASGQWRPFLCGIVPHGPLQPFSSQSAPYNIRYSYVSPTLNLPVLNTVITQPFDISVPLEVAGNYCDDDFTVILSGTPFCYDFSGASYSLVQSGEPPIPLPPAVDGVIRFDVSAAYFDLLPFCANNYPGGINDELTLKITGVRIPCGCMPAGSDQKMHIGFTPCSDTDAPADCMENGHVVPQISTDQEIHVGQVPVGSLTITNLDDNNNSSNHFKICGSTNVMRLQISNNSTEPVYDISFNVRDNLSYNIANIVVGGHIFNYNNTPTTNVNLPFGHNPFSNLGLQDLNGDGRYAELAPGHSINVIVNFTATTACSIGSSEKCPQQCALTEFDSTVIHVTVKWNNACRSLTPPAQTSLSYSVKISPIGMHVEYDGSKLVSNTPRQIDLDLSDGSITGLSSGYMNNGPLHQYLCIRSNVDACMYYSDVYIGGVPYPGTFTNGVIDLGVVSPDLIDDDTDISFAFTLLCCPNDTSAITFNIQVGAYFDDCPNCFITLACGDATFLSPCSGGSPNGACDAFFKPGFKCYNDVYTNSSIPPPPTANVYPCDDVVFELNPTQVMQNVGGYLLIGFTVSDALLSYIATPYTYNGNISVNGIQQAFQVMPIDPVPSEPYSIIYFRSTSPGLMSIGNTISGSFKVRMNTSFQGETFNKIDFFAPLLGYMNHGGRKFCGQFQDVYAMEVFYRVSESTTSSCETGGVYTISLIKGGGEFKGSGPDFPGISRPVARFTDMAPNNGIKTSINNDDPTYRILFAGPIPGPLNNPYTLSSTALTPPAGDEEEGDVLQTFVVGFEKNCAGDLPVNVLFDVMYLPGGPCQMPEPHSSNTSGGEGAAPNIAVAFEPSTLGPSEWVWNNAYTIHTSAKNTSSVSASHGWIELEYNPNEIEINPGDIMLGPGESFGFYPDPNNNPGNCPIKLMINYPVLAPGETRNNDFILHFLPGSCSPAMPKITVRGFHSCAPFDNYEPSCSTNPLPRSVCADSGDALDFEFYDADLTLQTHQCADYAILCNEFTVSVLLSNLKQGDVSDVRLFLDLPPGLQLLDIGFEIGGHLGDCNLQTDTIPVDTTGITSPDGRLIPTGILPGVQSGASNDERDVHLVLAFRSECGITPDDDDIVIRCEGLKPCGEAIQRESVVHDIFLAYDLHYVHVDMDEPVVTYDCSEGEGSVTFVVTSIVNLPPSGVAQITFPEIPGIVFHHPGDLVLNGPGTYTTSFTNENKTCEFDLMAEIEVCYTAQCTIQHTVCTVCDVVDEFTIHHSNPVGTLIIPAEVCEVGTNETVELTANVYIQDNMGNPAFFYQNASIICDVNGNGIQDPGEPVIYTKANGPLNGDGISGFYSTTFNVQAAAILGCLSQHLLLVFGQVTNKDLECVCVGPAVGSFCCGCPNWSITLTPSPTTIGSVDVNIQGGGNASMSCVEVITDGVTQDVEFTNHFTLLTQDGSQTCLRIRSYVAELPCEPTSCPPLEVCQSNCCYDYCIAGRGKDRSSNSANNGIAAETTFDVKAMTSVQPNPFGEQFVLKVLAPGTEQVSAYIFDQVGNQVFQSDYTLNGRGAGEYLISLKDAPAGTYYLKVDVADTSKYHLLIKQ